MIIRDHSCCSRATFGEDQFLDGSSPAYLGNTFAFTKDASEYHCCAFTLGKLFRAQCLTAKKFICKKGPTSCGFKGALIKYALQLKVNWGIFHTCLWMNIYPSLFGEPGKSKDLTFCNQNRGRSATVSSFCILLHSFLHKNTFLANQNIRANKNLKKNTLIFKSRIKQRLCFFI